MATWDSGDEAYYLKHDVPRLKKEGFFRIANNDIAEMYLNRVRCDYQDAIMIVDGIGQTFVATEQGKKNLIKYYNSKLLELADRVSQVERFISCLESHQFSIKR